jgi:hypothetical protein
MVPQSSRPGHSLLAQLQGVGRRKVGPSQPFQYVQRPHRLGLGAEPAKPEVLLLIAATITLKMLSSLLLNLPRGVMHVCMRMGSNARCSNVSSTELEQNSV